MKDKRIKHIEIISKGSYYNLHYTDRTTALLQVGKDRLVMGTEEIGFNFNGMDLSSDNLKNVLLSLGYPVVR